MSLRVFLYINVPYACLVFVETEEVIGFHGARITMFVLGSTLCTLNEHQVLLTAEHALRAHMNTFESY